MAVTDRYQITSDEGHTAECLAYATQTKRSFCIADCCRARHESQLAGGMKPCTCYHAPEQHAVAGCLMIGCECHWNGERLVADVCGRKVG